MHAPLALLVLQLVQASGSVNTVTPPSTNLPATTTTTTASVDERVVESSLDTLMALATGRPASEDRIVTKMSYQDNLNMGQLMVHCRHDLVNYADIGMTYFGNVRFATELLHHVKADEISLQVNSLGATKIVTKRLALALVAVGGVDMARECGFETVISDLKLEELLQSAPQGPVEGYKFIQLFQFAEEHCPEFITAIRSKMSETTRHSVIRSALEESSVKVVTSDLVADIDPADFIAQMSRFPIIKDAAYQFVQRISKSDSLNDYIYAAASAGRGDIMAYLLLHVPHKRFEAIAEMDWSPMGIYLPGEYNAMPIEHLMPFDNLKIVELLYKSGFKQRAGQYFKNAMLSCTSSPWEIILSASRCGSIELVCRPEILKVHGVDGFFREILKLQQLTVSSTAMQEDCIRALAKLYANCSYTEKSSLMKKLSYNEVSAVELIKNSTVWTDVPVEIQNQA